MRFDRYALTLAFSLLALSLAPTSVFAHAQLLHAVPGVGTTTTVAPSAITLSFSEAVEPAFCGASVTDGTGKAVALAKPASGPDKAVLVIGVKGKLAAGVYTVVWHAVAVDTHRTQGKFTFTIAP